MTYRDDEQAQNYKRIADLEEENRNLRSQAPKGVPWKFPKIDLEIVSMWTVYAGSTAVAALLFYCFYSYVMRTDVVEYCYIQESSWSKGAEYGLMGYRAWDENVVISRHDTIVNAYKTAEMLKCPLLKK